MISRINGHIAGGREPPHAQCGYKSIFVNILNNIAPPTSVNLSIRHVQWCAILLNVFGMSLNGHTSKGGESRSPMIYFIVDVRACRRCASWGVARGVLGALCICGTGGSANNWSSYRMEGSLGIYM